MAKLLFVGLLAGILACGQQVPSKSRVDDTGNLVSAHQDAKAWAASQADGSNDNSGLENPDTSSPAVDASGADNGATDEPDEGSTSDDVSPACTPPPEYEDGQSYKCKQDYNLKNSKKPCKLIWHSESCTWSCGVGPYGDPPYLFKELPADPTETFLSYQCHPFQCAMIELFDEYVEKTNTIHTMKVKVESVPETCKVSVEAMWIIQDPINDIVFLGTNFPLQKKFDFGTVTLTKLDYVTILITTAFDGMEPTATEWRWKEE